MNPSQPDGLRCENPDVRASQTKGCGYCRPHEQVAV